MAGLREFLNGPAGKGIAIGVVVIGLGAAIFSLKTSTDTPDVAAANERYFVDAKTGKSFKVDLKTGMNIPLKAPSGGATGYPAELCYWTADGKPKRDPTPVLLNTWLGKPGPTFCPECKRLVVGHNPQPGAGVKVPPMEAEYRSTHKGNNQPDDR